MGKMKITKKNKRNKPSSGMPNWLLTTIVAVVIIAVLLTCVFSLLSSNAVVLRMGTAMKSADYTVNGNMMRYYYASTYNTFLDSYGTYSTYMSIQNAPINEHNSITFGGTAENPNTYDSMFLGSFTGTWFDYFMNSTKESVRVMLMYCEKADDLGITLTDQELADIDAAIESAITEFKYQQLLESGTSDISDATCLAAMYGTGMKRSDIRKAMKLSTLAAKCQQQIYDSIEAGITDERINAEYEANKQDYDRVDYIYYTFSAVYEDSVEAVAGANADDATVKANESKINDHYKAAIEAAKAAATEAQAKTSAEEFKSYLYNYIAEKSYDDLFAGKNLESDKLPTDEDLKFIKDKMIAAVAAEAAAGATEATEDVKESIVAEGAKLYTIYDKNVSQEFADALKTIKISLFASVTAVDNSYTMEKATYTADDDLSTWLFDGGRAVGDKHRVESGDAANSAEFAVTDERFDAKVYYLTKPRYKDEALTKNVEYMMFTSEATAKAAIEALIAKGTMTQEIFAASALELGSSYNALVENYQEGQMQSSTFDSWLYDATTVRGNYTTTPLKMEDESYMVAYYVADGLPEWTASVKNSLINADYETQENELSTAYSTTITMSNWVFDMIAKQD